MQHGEKLNHSHHYDLFDPRVAQPVILIGAGSVGSHVALQLAKMGVRNITVWDGDSVASHNVPMSVYRPSDLGKPKTVALAEILHDFAGVTVKAIPRMYDGEDLGHAIVIACVDSMATRAKIWESVLRGAMTIPLFFDTRTYGAYVEILSIAPLLREECEWYKLLQYSDAESLRAFCGLHGIIFAAQTAASIVSSQFASFLKSGERVWRVAMRCDSLERII